MSGGMGRIFGGIFGSKSDQPVIPPAPVATNPPTIPQNIPGPSGDVPWMAWMESHIGEPEVTGSKATAFDKMVFSHTSDDEVQVSGIMAAGCAATVCAALELTGYKSTHRADAKSYDTYGTPCELKPGCVVTFRWDGGGRHVTFCKSINSDGTINALGGNQSGKLQVSTYGKSHIVATRWPVKP